MRGHVSKMVERDEVRKFKLHALECDDAYRAPNGSVIVLILYCLTTRCVDVVGGEFQGSFNCPWNKLAIFPGTTLHILDGKYYF